MKTAGYKLRTKVIAQAVQQWLQSDEIRMNNTGNPNPKLCVLPWNISCTYILCPRCRFNQCFLDTQTKLDQIARNRITQ